MPNSLEQPLVRLGFGQLARYCVLGAAVLLTVGCRETPTTVKGQVTLNGKPLSIVKGMRGTVVFQPTVANGTTLSGLIDSSGHYELATGGSHTVIPSSYWVTVSAMEIVPPSAAQPQSSGRLVTPAKYASATDSGFRIEVLPGANEVNLPLVSEAESSTVVEADPEPKVGEAESADVESSEASAPAQE